MQQTGYAKLLALSVALVFHAMLAVALVAPEATEIEGAAGGTDIKLGNAFSDMAAGTLTAMPPDSAETTQAETAQPSQTEQPDTLSPETATAQAQRETPRATLPTAAPAAAPLTKPSNADAKTATPAPTMAAQPVPVTRAMPSDPVQVASAVPAQAQMLQPGPVAERMVAEDPETAPLPRSLRPRPRSAEVAMAQPKPKPAPAQARGNADRNARAGIATGQQHATARQNGREGHQQAAGNAAASNYPGLVMRQLSRAGKPRVTAHGAAVIAFSIAADGGLASVSLARSSGSAQLDQAALRLVRGAGPFPRPPQGARRSFSIQIKGR